MMLSRLLRRDSRGIGAVEFALVAPVLIAFVVGISQMGKLFYANADMKNALASGARVASVWPVPEDDVIVAAVKDRIARTRGIAAATVTTERGTDSNGNAFVNIKMDYKVPLDFIFFDVSPVTLRDSRQVYLQMALNVPANSTTSASTTSTTSSGDPGTTTTSTTSSGDPGTTTSTTSTTSGGDPGTTTSTTSTTSGGTTSTSTTSGGTTSSTSASSTGGTSASSSTSASSTSTSSSSGNGNSNGNSSHGHGTCNKKC